jgi:hypothetical protein
VGNESLNSLLFTCRLTGARSAESGGLISRSQYSRRYVSHQLVVLLVGGAHQILLQPGNAVGDTLAERKRKRRRSKSISALGPPLCSMLYTCLSVLCSHLRLGDEQCSGRFLGLQFTFRGTLARIR